MVWKENVSHLRFAPKNAACSRPSFLVFSLRKSPYLQTIALPCSILHVPCPVAPVSARWRFPKPGICLFHLRINFSLDRRTFQRLPCRLPGKTHISPGHFFGLTAERTISGGAR